MLKNQFTDGSFFMHHFLNYPDFRGSSNSNNIMCCNLRMHFYVRNYYFYFTSIFLVLNFTFLIFSFHQILPLKGYLQSRASSAFGRWSRQSSTTVILYALPLVLLIVLTRDNGGQRSTDLVAQKVAEIYENDHVIIAFVSC